ncbi:MAG: glycosyltransferase family 2 protein [Spirochaetaceae bacterium]|jgi:glycosyltransferase involved in cell wall biosynthesis|nr:glycosyltransferase family 2 protein [Spirochaetaceae bacterium]
MKKVSVLLRCRNEEENVEEISAAVIKQFEDFLPDYDYEILFIDNCSEDNTREKIRKLCAKNKKIKAIFNSANFKDSSAAHGVLQCTGDCCLNIPSDFQVPVELIPEFVKKWDKGHDVVFGIKVRSSENIIMWAIRNLFHNLMRSFSGGKYITNISGVLISRNAIEMLRKMPDANIGTSEFIADYGLKYDTIPHIQAERKHGKSNFSFLGYVVDAFEKFVSGSRLGSHLALYFGFILSIICFIIGIIYLVLKLLYWQNYPAGTAPLIIGLFFLGSVQIFFTGLVGEYVIALQNKFKKRPYAIEAERINFDMPETPDRI